MENHRKAGSGRNTALYSSYSKKHKDYTRGRRRRENMDEERTVTALIPFISSGLHLASLAN
jgi:hypothetical protein